MTGPLKQPWNKAQYLGCFVACLLQLIMSQTDIVLVIVDDTEIPSPIDIAAAIQGNEQPSIFRSPAPQSCVDIVSAVDQEPSLSTLAEIYKADSLDSELKSNLNNPNFAAVICAPTDEAFNQFYDRNNIDKSTFLANPELVNQVVKVNIIPGGFPGGTPPSDGNSIFVDTLLPDQQLQITNNGGEIIVDTDGGAPSAKVVGQNTSPCQAAVSFLDEVLEPKNIGDLLCSNYVDPVDSDPNLSTLAQVFKSDALDSELKSSLNDPSFAAVICAPTDEAFDQFFDDKGIDQSTFLANPDLVNQVMKVNIIPGGLPGGAPPEEGQQTIAPTLTEGEDLVLSNQRGSIFVTSASGQTAQVVGADATPCNGAVSSIDKVLLPSNIDDLLVDTQGSCGSVLDAVDQQPQLSQLAALFKANGLDDTLKSDLNNPGFAAVICAPNDDAFDQFYDKYDLDQSTFLANPKLVNQVVKVNIIPGGLPGGAPPADGESLEAPTLLGDQTLTLNNQGSKISVEDPNGLVANVLDQDTSPCNAAISFLDTVLEPLDTGSLVGQGGGVSDGECLNVVDAVKANTDLSTLAGVFQVDALEPELKSSLSDPAFASVICAPTNDAFDQFFDRKSIDKSTFLSNPELINQVVKVNIIPGGLPGGAPPSEGNQYRAPTLLGNQTLVISNIEGDILVFGPEGPTAKVQGFSEPAACQSAISIIDGVLLPDRVDQLIDADATPTPNVGGQSNLADQQKCTNVVTSTENQPDLTTLAAAFKSDALDPELKSSLNDNTYQATICAPTDDAFDQFFDSNNIDKSTFLGNPQLLNQVVKVNIIPGPPGTPADGQQVVVPTLLDGGDLVISNDGGKISVQGPGGPQATVQKLVDEPCESVLAFLDQVLLPDASQLVNPNAIGENFLP